MFLFVLDNDRMPIVGSFLFKTFYYSVDYLGPIFHFSANDYDRWRIYFAEEGAVAWLNGRERWDSYHAKFDCSLSYRVVWA